MYAHCLIKLFMCNHIDKIGAEDQLTATGYLVRQISHSASLLCDEDEDERVFMYELDVEDDTAGPP